MSAVITIKIPSETVTTEMFAKLEGYATDTVRKMTRMGKLPIAPKKLTPGKKCVRGRTSILYAKFKEESMRAQGYKHFEIVIGN